MIQKGKLEPLTYAFLELLGGGGGGGGAEGGDAMGGWFSNYACFDV